MHALKTDGLFRAAVLGVAAWAAAPPEMCTVLERYACSIGCLFQLRDDVLDIDGTTARLGKPTGADARNQRQTAASTGANLDVTISRLPAEAADALAEFNEPPSPQRALIDLAGCRDY
jgi:geranylgeranyl pyrophosphate synthase